MIVVLFGPPGSGKGTQAAFVTQAFALPHVSTGDMLRDASRTGHSEVAALMAAGKLIPDEFILGVIGERLYHEDVRDGLVLDGFPRTVAQARALDVMLSAIERRVDLVVALAVPVDELLERLLARARQQERSDDKAEAIRERFVEYEGKTTCVLDYYRARGTCIADIDGVGRIEQVRERIHVHVASAVRRVVRVTLTGRRAPTRRTQRILTDT